MTDTHAAKIVQVEIEDVDAKRMHPLVRAGMASGIVDPATLREYLAVQREYEAGEARKAYTRALAALKRDLPTVIHKDATVDFTNKSGVKTFYTHTSLAGVMEAVTGPLTAHGFSLSWTPAMGEKHVRVTCRLTHSEGHHEEATLEAPSDTSGNKSPAQAIASTITLLQRYTALAILGIATADMREPTGEDAPEESADHVDAAKNMRAVAAISKAHRTIAAAEKIAGGRAASQWTAADRVALKAWLAKPDVEQPIEGEIVDEHGDPDPSDADNFKD